MDPVTKSTASNVIPVASEADAAALAELEALEHQPETEIAPEAGKLHFSATGSTIEEFAVSVAQTLMANHLIVTTATKAGKPIAKFVLNDGRWGAEDAQKPDYLKRIVLGPAAARSLGTSKGLPLELGFNVTLMDIVPANRFASTVRERQVASAERETKSGARLSDDAVRQEAIKRGFIKA